MTDQYHWQDAAELDDWGESSGTGAWIKLKMKKDDMDKWRQNKKDTYSITACLVRENADGDYELVKEVVWRNEGLLIGYGENSSKFWAKFVVEPRDLDFFRGNKGQVYFWRFIAMDKLEGVINAEQKAATEKGPYGKDVQRLHQYGFFRAPAVWEALGTDDDYQAWTRKQPCIVTGGVDWDEDKGEGRCEFAHVRRAGASGTAHKAEYSGVPLVHEIHANYQHQHGETAAFKYYVDKNRRKIAITPEIAKAWFDKKAAENVANWAHERLCEELGTPSLTMVEPAMVRKWAEDHNITQFLPRNYREAT